MRKLTKTLAFASLLVPASAHSLGIGEITMHSALNQKLSAEIGLVLSAGETLNDIKVKLASPDKFNQSGIPWSHFLSKIKFKAVKLPSGSTVIKLTSTETLREPFLDFLLEVSWSTGNLYREFTVLVDPPASYQPATPTVTPAQQAGTTQATQQESDSKLEAFEPIGGSRYVRTQRNDSLWKVAERVSPVGSGVSIEQMMMALYKANPNAFYQDNVNALMSGRRLQIPSVAEIQKVSKTQARREFKQQYAAWKNRGASKKSAADSPTSIAEPELSNQLQLEAPEEADISDSAQIAANREQEVSPPLVADSGGAESRGVNDQLMDRLEKMERQMAMMQKMLSVKDSELAALQDQLRDQKTEEAVDSETVKTVPTKTPTEAGVEDKPETVQQTEVDQKTPLVDKQPKAVVKDAKTTTKPEPQPKKQATKEVEPGLFEDGGYTIITGSLAFLLIGLLGFLWWRKRQNEDSLDTESMFASSSEIRMPDSELDMAVTSMEDTTAYDVGTVGESSFLSEFTPSDFDGFDTEQNEVDPISEADVYLAYGRYQQAEELMRQAIVDYPARNDCKLKLLEIYYANEDKEGFEHYVEELSQQGMQKDGAFWSKVMEMAGEITPSAAADLSSQEADEIGSEIDENLIAFDSTPEKAKSEEELVLQPELDELDNIEFSGPDLEAANEGQQDSAPSTEADDDFDLDFDLSEFENVDIANFPELDDEELEGLTETKDQESDQQKSAEMESIEFDMEASEPDQTESNLLDFEAEAKQQVDDDQDGVDLELSESFDLSDEKGDAEDEQDDKKEEFDFDFDFDESGFLGEEMGSDLSAVSDLTDMDEYETKIDLAKAYIDMGDVEAAKNIAEEVIEKGNEKQKETAKSLLKEL